MKRLIPLIGLLALIMVLAGSSRSAVSDTRIPITDSKISDNKIATNQARNK